jgi:hypothetical protein
MLCLDAKKKKKTGQLASLKSLIFLQLSFEHGIVSEGFIAVLLE